jgi:hypothetical protein
MCRNRVNSRIDILFNMKTGFFFISLITTCFFAQGQEKTIYIDSCENYVDENSYSIRRTVSNHPDNKFTYTFKDYYKNGTIFTGGIAKSRNGKTKEGDFIFFHSNNQKLANGQLTNDLKKGNWKYFDSTGLAISKDELIKQLPTIEFIKDDISYEGKCLCYNKEGGWEEENIITKVITTRYYEDGQEVAVDGIYNIVDDSASYGTGMTEFYKYLVEKLKYPFITRLKGKYGKVFVKFTIDKQGNLGNLNFLLTFG